MPHGVTPGSLRSEDRRHVNERFLVSVVTKGRVLSHR